MFGDLPETGDPFGLFAAWMREALKSEPRDADAAALATVDSGGLPDVRMVLVKKVDERGFTFFTNAESAKGSELAGNPKAALVLYWKSLNRQVRVRGPVEQISAQESDDYFASRPRGAQVGAWASKQSRPLESRKALEAAVARYEKEYAEKVPRPPYWVGYRVVPLSIEFWADRPFRLHERLVFTRATIGKEWTRTRLYP
ncbi:MAG TPA: pyridoxamine 5'-phosphate oxidase [Xanthobacteraceae bacterium]|nr:pyridoxamine 5'-phosphate oxidase [Xanthobacteraceae bacterium]